MNDELARNECALKSLKIASNILYTEAVEEKQAVEEAYKNLNVPQIRIQKAPQSVIADHGEKADILGDKADPAKIAQKEWHHSTDRGQNFKGGEDLDLVARSTDRTDMLIARGVDGCPSLQTAAMDIATVAGAAAGA